MSFAATGVAAPPAVQAIDLSHAISVRPDAVAPLVLVDGEWVPGEWSDAGGTPRLSAFVAWDAFGRDWGPGSNDNPIYANHCGLASPADRYFLGWGYHAPYIQDEMWDIASPGANITEFSFAWTWESPGPCTVFVMLSDLIDDACHTVTPYGGFAFSFNFLPGAFGTAYHTTVAPIPATRLPMGGSGDDGTYIIKITDGAGNPPLGPTQPLLWSNKRLLTPPFDTAPYIEGYGFSYPQILADDNPTDFNLDIFECYYHNLACPASLNAMAGFGVASPPCPPCTPIPVTKHYLIRRLPNGQPWSWGLAETPAGFPLSAHGNHPGVVGGTNCTLATALATEINNYSAANLCPTTALSATVSPCRFLRSILHVTALVCPGSSFDLFTGNGPTPTCRVPVWPASFCTFNPDIAEVILSGNDCNGNGEDDAIDIAMEDSADVNNNGIPDECEQCPADFDGDGFVSGVDFDLYVNAFESGDAAADFDGDGFVSGIDFDLFVAAFEKGC